MKKLIVKDVTISYPDETAAIIDNISFELHEGSSLLIAGASGCGKSTLAAAIAGLIPEAIEATLSGTIKYGDIDLHALDKSQNPRPVGIVFQDPDAQFCMLTVEEEVAFSLENIHYNQLDMDEKISDVLALVGLSDYRHYRIDRLSGGYRQRLALACVLSQSPEILILDEPTANLDPLATQDFFKLLENLQKNQKQTFILIEHKLEHPAQYIEKTMVLNEGKIEIFENTRVVFEQQSGLLDSLGVWEPYAAEIGQRCLKMMVPLSFFPLSLAELKSTLNASSKSHQRLKDSLSQDIKNFPSEINDEVYGLKNVSFSYKNGQRYVPILNKLTWSIPKGSFTAIVGANGAGKSTLGRMLLGLLKPTKGKISLQNKDLKDYNRRQITRKVGLVFQNPEHQFIADNVWNEVAYTFKLMGKDEETTTREVRELLEEFHLLQYASQNPFSLSQGEKRRLSVAAMLSTGQDVLVLDELSFGQDKKNTYRLMNLVLERQKKGCTIIIITHDMRLVSEYATHVAVLHEGHFAFTGDVETFYTHSSQFEAWSLTMPPRLQVLDWLGEK